MIESQEEALEAAKLAALVGAQLGAIDKMSDGGSTQRANKINVQKFIAKAQNPNLQIGPERYLVDVPAGFAPPPDESFVQASIPDVYPVNRPPQSEYVQPIPTPVIAPVHQVPVKPNFEIPNTPNPINDQKYHIKSENNNLVFTRSDVDSIRNSLKSIDKTLAGMLNFLKNSKP